jgi:tRNA nucleotidyltransferase (CCA-adding enzyme)
MLDTFVTHSTITEFADDRVNLGRDDVAEHREQVNRMRDKLEHYIAEHPGFDLVKMLHTGSVAKGTALKTLQDMDVAVYLEAGKAPEDEDKLHAWLIERLRLAYPQKDGADFNAEHHCVTVKFIGSGLKVDVVPVIYEGEANDVGYLITKDTGDRVKTSVRQHLEFIRRRKEAHKTHYRQMVRLVKWWAKIQKSERENFRCKSFMIELILAHLFDGGFDGADYVSALFNFFSYVVRTGLREQIVFTDNYKASDVTKCTDPIRIFDPVNSANNVACRYTDAERAALVSAAEDAVDAIAYARRATTKGEAVAEWQTIFGSGFRG